MSDYEDEVSCPYCGIIFDGMGASDRLSEHLRQNKECKRKYEKQLESLAQTFETKENKDRISQIKDGLRKRILLRLSKEHPYLIPQIAVDSTILDKMVENELLHSALKSKDIRRPMELPIVRKMLNEEYKEIKETAKQIGVKMTDKRAKEILDTEYRDKPKEKKESEKLSKEETAKEEILKGIASLSKEEEDELLKRFLRRTMKRK